MSNPNVTHESFQEENNSILESSVEESFNRETSFEGPIIEESFISNRSSLQSPNQFGRESFNNGRNNTERQISSSEDESFGFIAKANRQRVKRISSNSDDDGELDTNQASTSLRNRRAVKAIVSDESHSEIEENSMSDSSHADIEDNNSVIDPSHTEIEQNNSLIEPKHSEIEENESDSDDDGELDANQASTSFRNRRAAKAIVSDESHSEIEENSMSDSSHADIEDNNSVIDSSHTEIEQNNSLIEPKHSEIEENESVIDSSQAEIEQNSSVVDPSHAEIEKVERTEENLDINDSDVQCVEKTQDVIAISSGDEDEKENIDVGSMKNRSSTKLKQVTLDSMVQNLSLKENTEQNKAAADIGDTLYCTTMEYGNQATLVSNLRTDILRSKNALRTINVDGLPDKGALLKKRLLNLEINIAIEEKKLSKMVVETPDIKDKKPGGHLSWDQLQANSAAVVPRTFGAAAMNTYTAQKALTMDRLKNLHTSLATCPSEDTHAEDPRGLRIELMRHQQRALAWLMWRESQKPAGGILADDMGLGKTLTMISLVLKANETNNTSQSDSDNESEEKSVTWKSKGRNALIPGGSLVVCPATLLKQWEAEVEKRCKRNLLNVELYHGAKREAKATRLAKHDMVITTYKLVMGDYEKKGPLFYIKWARIILDEAHVVRNHKSRTSLAVCGLSGKSRWALTGTPVHNKELDLYALMKFLRCSPFDDLHVWKQWVANKNAGGQDRLNTVMTSIMLRRTKEQLQADGSLKGLPEKKFEVIEVKLDAAETKIYQKVLIFSRTLFTQFLHQREAKNSDLMYSQGSQAAFMQTTNIDADYVKMHKKVLQMHGSTEVKSHEILVLLLRLRQICCHPSLIVNMLDKENCIEEGIEDEEGLDIDILDKLNNLKLDDEEASSEQPDEPVDFNTAASRVLSVSNPVFDKDRPNGKIRVIQDIIRDKVLSQGDKVIVVSQWTSMLQIVLLHLKQANFNCAILDGKVPVHKRNEIVSSFNDPRHRTQVLLLSLTAGGVGLNLVGANHLLLLDLHWNPQLESQAQDRIYRMGQKKVVHIYKLVTTDTIEERIKALQENKLAMASDILSGTRAAAGSKLTINDLKMLFNIAV